MEYDPAPPFHSGSPQRASPAHVEAVRGAVEPVDVEVARVAVDLERWGWGRGRVA
jgi:hypothetical protein